jgi:hypothetical protein
MRVVLLVLVTVAETDTGGAGATIPSDVWFDLLVMLIMW